MIGALIGLITVLVMFYIKYRFHLQFAFFVARVTKWIKDNSDEPKSREDR